VGVLIGVGAKVLLAGGLGFGLRRSGFVSAQFAQDLGRLLIWVITPFAIVVAAAQPYSPELARSVVTVTLISAPYFALAAVSAWAAAKAMPLDGNTRRAFVNLVTFPNVTFIGLPIITELYGTPGLLCSVAGNLVFNLVFFTFGQHNMIPGRRFSMKPLVKSPIMIACGAAVVLYFSPVALPEALGDALGMIGGAMAPLAMMIVGFGLADSNLADLVKNPYGYLANLLRLVVWPLAILAVVRLAGLDGIGGEVAAIMYGLPCGTLTVVLAAQHRTAYQFAAQTVVQSNVLMFATLPALFWAVQLWQ
jgi:predicted permease